MLPILVLLRDVQNHHSDDSDAFAKPNFAGFPFCIQCF